MFLENHALSVTGHLLYFKGALFLLLLCFSPFCLPMFVSHSKLVIAAVTEPTEPGKILI